MISNQIAGYKSCSVFRELCAVLKDAVVKLEYIYIYIFFTSGMASHG